MSIASIFLLGGIGLGEHMEDVFDPEPQVIEYADTSQESEEDDPHLPLQLVFTLAGATLGSIAAMRFVEYPDGQASGSPFTAFPRRPFM